MNSFDPAAFAVLVALVGLVILVASLTSGAMERLGLPAVAIFLGLGALLGPHVLGLIDFGIDSATLGAIATLSLVLVLFTDAMGVNFTDLKAHLRVADIVLGPGTLLSAALTAVAAWKLLHLPFAATILGAALASTDPVMMRGLLRLPEVPGAARSALRIESGLNDVVLLPIVLVAMVFLGKGGMPPAGEIGRMFGSIFVIGPVAGAAIGFLAVNNNIDDIIRLRYTAVAVDNVNIRETYTWEVSYDGTTSWKPLKTYSWITPGPLVAQDRALHVFAGRFGTAPGAGILTVDRGGTGRFYAPLETRVGAAPDWNSTFAY